MKATEIDTLRQVKNLAEPRHLFVVPESMDPVALDRLIQEGYLTCEHKQSDDKGGVRVAMGLQLTPKGEGLLSPRAEWPKLAIRGSLAGASFVVMSVVILYVG